jgi:hypothetical protein
MKKRSCLFVLGVNDGEDRFMNSQFLDMWCIHFSKFLSKFWMDLTFENRTRHKDKYRQYLPTNVIHHLRLASN